ncbi:dual specificity protein phosphatase 14-like [Rhizophagus irregularis DAOM 181602=DAOM 197198]|nr:dual specificity protein phosphatase 14-like [Rhizophagus irregularis DAOM 181602=DAOM 197198]
MIRMTLLSISKISDDQTNALETRTGITANARSTNYKNETKLNGCELIQPPSGEYKLKNHSVTEVYTSFFTIIIFSVFFISFLTITNMNTQFITVGDIRLSILPIKDRAMLYQDQFVGGVKVPHFKTSTRETSLSVVAIELANKADKPTEIIEDFLYISDAVTAANSRLLAENKISHIVNISPCINFFGPSRITYCISQKYPDWKPKYLRLYVSDDPKGKISKFFEVSNAFIHEANQEGGRVLIHCWAGVSRSATLVLAYLLKQGLTYLDAFNHLKKRRSIIEPNSGFCLQLTKYEIELLKAQGIPINGNTGNKRKYTEYEVVINADDNDDNSRIIKRRKLKRIVLIIEVHRNTDDLDSTSAPSRPGSRDLNILASLHLINAFASPTLPLCFNNMDTIFQLTIWLCANPNVLQFANDIYSFINANVTRKWATDYAIKFSKSNNIND